MKIFLKVKVPLKLHRGHQALGGNNKTQGSMHAGLKKTKAAIRTRVRKKSHFRAAVGKISKGE